MNAAVIDQNVIGEYLEKKSQIRTYADRYLDNGLDEDSSNILILFANKNKKIVAVENFGEAKAEEFDATEIAKTALKNDASEIFIAYRPAQFSDEEWEAVKDKKDYVDSSRVFRRLKNPEEVSAFVKLAKNLLKHGVVLGDIEVCDYNSAFYYSDNISQKLFPSFGVSLVNDARAFDLSFKGKHNKNNVYMNLREQNRNQSSKDIAKNVHAVFLDNKDKVLSQYEVPVDNQKLIPGLIKDRKCMFDPIFQQAVKENAQSIVLIRKFDGYDIDAPAVEDIDILRDARGKSGKYGVPLRDYIILGYYSEHGDEFSKLSFVESFGMK